MPPFEDRFERHLRFRKILNPGEKVYIGCSGGPDSMALLHLLSGLSDGWNLRLGVLHFHHGLRGREADRDQRFVEKAANGLGLPVHTDLGRARKLARTEKWSLEEAARHARYDFFIKTARRRRIPKIALAHTLDDQAETLLMRMIQGTGLPGLLAIRERLERDRVTFIRPLLAFPKKEITKYLRARKILFRKDLTNDSERFLRNRIRRRLIPLLEKEFNPRVKEALGRIPASVAAENEVLERGTDQAWGNCVRAVRRGKIFLHRKGFDRLEPALKFRLIQRVLKRLDPKSGLSFENWEKLRPGLERLNYRHSLQRDIDICLSDFRVVIYKKKGHG